MKRFLSCLAMMLALVCRTRGEEEVEWRAAAPSNMSASIVPAPAKEESVKDDKRILWASEQETPPKPKLKPTLPITSEPPKTLPPPEPIPPPRPAAPPTPAAPAEPPMRTLNLVGEYCFGAEPPPVDVGQRMFFRAEWLLWFAQRMAAPPLVTSATPPNLGFLGGPTTQVLYGNGPIGDPF